MPKLYVVATPIGNLSDLTQRMRQALEGAALIAAEDTRVTQKLLSVMGISRPMVSNHQHNEEAKAPRIIEKMLSEDIDVALTCDAGTPGISDPGMELVAAAWDAGVEVVPVAGPSAGIVALSAAGFNAREFAFYGFLPREKGELRRKLRGIAHGPRVAVIYESPHRVVDLMECVADEIPGARACVCCDLTKRFEKIERGAVSDVLERLRANPNVEKGEYCIALELPEPGPEPQTAAAVTPRHMLIDAVLDGMTIKQAVKHATAQGANRAEAYAAGLELKRWLESQLDEE